MNFEEYLQFNRQNLEASRKFLGDDMRFFTVAQQYYDSLTGHAEKEKITGEQFVLFQHLCSCFVNLVKGTCLLLEGHLVESNIFIRKTAECVRESIFLRDHPEHRKLWMKTYEAESRKKFDNVFRSWHQKNKEKIEAEFKGLKTIFDLGSNIGTHSNVGTSSFQMDVGSIEKQTKVTVKFHQIDPNRVGAEKLKTFYFWTIRVHFEVQRWFKNNSSLKFSLEPDLQSFWSSIYADVVRISDNQERFEY